MPATCVTGENSVAKPVHANAADNPSGSWPHIATPTEIEACGRPD
ncbi:MAG: hypothetical protein ACJA07_000499 [Rhodococcus sp. (in: high G+C Gram-positive bacteria)]|jgi:hypothetical protein